MKRIQFVCLLILLFPIARSQQIVGYHWWLDSDPSVEGMEALASSNEFEGAIALDLSAVPQGQYMLNIRFLDDQGLWSPVDRNIMVKTADGKGEHTISDVEYWYDDNTSERLVMPLDTDNDTLSGIVGLMLEHAPTGTRDLSFRFRNSSGYWSPITSKPVLKTPEGDAEALVEAIEFWIDNDPSTRQVYFPDDPAKVLELTVPLNLDAIEKGNHLFSMRAMDNLGHVSPVQNAYIKKYPAGYSENRITGYRYWFNDSIQTLNEVDLPSAQDPLENSYIIPVDGFPPGDTVRLCMQFQDLMGMWSGISVDTFLVYQVSGIMPNTAHSNWIKIYPNPTSELLQVELNADALNGQPMKAEVIDFQGKVCRVETINNAVDALEMDIRQLEPGIYVLKLSNPSITLTRNFLVR